MKKLRGSLLAKIIAIFLLVILAVTSVVCAFGIGMLVNIGGYNGSYDAGDTVAGIGYSNLQYATDQLTGPLSRLCSGTHVDTEEFAAYSDDAFRYTLYDETGDVLYDNLEGKDTVWRAFRVLEYYITTESDGTLSLNWNSYVRSGLYDFATPKINSNVPNTVSAPDTDYMSPQPSPTQMPVREEEAEQDGSTERVETRRYVIQGYILANPPTGTRAQTWLTLADWCYGFRYWFIGILAASLLLCVALFIFLMCAAGHRDDSDAITKNAIDRIPFDLFLFLMISGVCLLTMPILEGFLSDSVFTWVIAAIMFTGAFLLALLFCMSFATRMKAESFTGLIKSCIVYKLLRWCWRLIKKLLGALAALLKALPLLGRWGIALIALLLVEFFYTCANHWDMGMMLFGWFVERAALVALLLYAMLCVKKLRMGAKELASGNDGYKINTDKMRGVFREHAEDLNSIGTGISRAVNERMKSERLRTELITNVSHDIKTPLTSIVNYVDLLGKEEPENEKMREYIEVLSRQSARLKKLIDDLIEASKASTGNLNVNLQRCELGVLLDQTAGEYGERLSKAGLELVLTKPEEPVIIMADGRHMWRVFDNLMNNACKYAQPGTRVYLTLNRVGDRANIIFRNISRTMLNISGDELMERFVRGDSSRNTEGSGLGLSIARSLIQLQGGDMELTLDGDLFKVTISFRTVN